jgi:hypothetical protein
VEFFFNNFKDNIFSLGRKSCTRTVMHIGECVYLHLTQDLHIFHCSKKNEKSK